MCSSDLIIGVPLLVAARPLDVFAYGDLTARSLGVHVGRVRWILLAADRAVAELVRCRRMAVDGERNRPAAARTFKSHRHVERSRFL